MIRLMTTEDVRFFNEVRNECSQWLHDPKTYTYKEALSWFKNTENPYFIYELEENKIGYFRTSHWEEGSCFVGMDIHEDHRGKKLAVPAYNEFFAFLKKEHGIKKFKLTVLGKNERALNLYKKLGFKIIEKNLHGRLENIVMEK